MGTQIGVASVELRFPILNPSFGISGAFPPLEGAIFYDVGLVWDDNTTIRWKRRVGDSPTGVRTPLKTVGFALRTNLFGFAIASFPDGVGRCSYYADFFAPLARSAETAPLLDGMIELNWRVLLEDLASQTHAQKSMECGALGALRLQYQERRIRYVHEEIDRRIGPERVPAPLRVPPLLDAYVEKE